MTFGFLEPFQRGQQRPTQLEMRQSIVRVQLDGAKLRSASRHLCRRVFTKVTSPDAEPLFNWYEKIAAESHRSAVLPAM